MKKEHMVGSRLPKELIDDLEAIENIEQTDRSTTIRKLLSGAIKEWKLDYYAKQYGAGKKSLATASNEAGVTLWEMMEYTRSHKISAQYDLDDLKKDIATVRDRVATSEKP